jgi:hypothetical protein
MLRQLLNILVSGRLLKHWGGALGICVYTGFPTCLYWNLKHLLNVILHSECTCWRNWLTHCATSRKVAGSIPDGVIGFSWLNPPGPTMATGVDSVCNRNTYQEYLLGGGGAKDGRCVGLRTLPPSRADCPGILGASTSWNPKGLSRSVQG